MYVASQEPYDDETLRFLKQMGVDHVDIQTHQGFGVEVDGSWHADELMRLREHVESFGLTLDGVHLPLTSAGIERQVWPNIMLGTPERDRDIERVCKSIAAAAQAGIPMLPYNLAILPVVRGKRVPGRGGVTYSHFCYEEMKDDPPLPYAPVTADMAWERIGYFVERVVPVAEEYGVKLACHQHDPAMPPGVGYRGIERVLGSVAGVKRFLDLHPSPYHGLNLCQGTVAEMCTSPEQVYDAIRYFAGTGRVFWVHLRNIRGGYLDFCEVYPDEGDIDLLESLRIYREAGYDGAIVPDHVPQSDLDSPHGHRSRAFCFGYLNAALQAVQGGA